jgi:chromosome segregation ATPase
MSRTRALLILLLSSCFVLAGCGSSPREVTKAQYQQELTRLGTNLTDLGSELGKSIDIATFNQNVQDLQDGLDDAAHDLNALEPPANVQDANDRLATALSEFSDRLEAVKEARRESIVKARAELMNVSRSAPIRDGRAAVRELKRNGYDVAQLTL